MTPAARTETAIRLLDRILAGEATEPVLTGWARANRYAGSGDRAALRDLVYDALRRRRSLAALGGAETGRGLLLGRCRAEGADPTAIFSGARYAPTALSPAEADALAAPVTFAENVALDCPDWIAPALRAALGPDFAPVMAAQRDRAPLFLRANLRRGDRTAAAAALAAEGIETRVHPLADTVLEVTANARRVQASRAYRDGLVEVQDASSQAVIAALEPKDGARVLDYCAGGGGKVLALAARMHGRFVAHDVDPGRMRDLPARAARAGVEVELLPPGRATGFFDLVLVDAPCSGSGTWRRTPDAKWRLTPARLAELAILQERILAEAAALTAPGGEIAYMTCSLLEAENGAQRAGFLAGRPDWSAGPEISLTPLTGGDGFYLARLGRRPRW